MILSLLFLYLVGLLRYDGFTSKAKKVFELIAWFWRLPVLVEISAELKKELSLLPKPSKLMVIGEPDTGKSTLVTLLARWFWSMLNKVAVVDSDIGQADVGPPGFVSFGFVEETVTSLQSVTRNGSYLVGNTSPYGRELPVILGTQVCVNAAEQKEPDVILIDTCGLVKPDVGVQLKCAKAGTIRPDLVITLSTPALHPLTNHLRSVGFQVRSFMPLKETRIKSTDKRRKNRVFRWNKYLSNSTRIQNIDLSCVEIYRWWGETRHVDVDDVPHGSVVAVSDLQSPGFHVPCIWTVSENGPSILGQLPQNFEPETIWVTSYKVSLDGTRVTLA